MPRLEERRTGVRQKWLNAICCSNNYGVHTAWKNGAMCPWNRFLEVNARPEEGSIGGKLEESLG